MNTIDIAMRLRSIASAMTYNGSRTEVDAKYRLYELAGQLHDGTLGLKAAPPTTAEEAAPQPSADTITATLAERGKRYGVFSKHAEVTQAIKHALFTCRARSSLAPDQVEALEMIAHKLGRIVNGDPDYADSWVDIAGYAKLVADRLQGTSR